MMGAVGALFSLLVVAAVVAWWLKRRAARGDDPGEDAGPFRFRVRFRAGKVRSVEGQIARATLAAFEDIAAHADLTGEVRLVGLAELQFSDEIPAFARQQLRNALVTSLAVH